MGKKTILLIDDDKDFVESVADCLEAEGFGVLKAHDGVEGWAKIRSGKPDLIILDVMMPGKHGYKVEKDLEESEYASIPVIMLTAVADHVKNTTFTHAEGLECGADDFLAKPVDMKDLLQSVHRLLG